MQGFQAAPHLETCTCPQAHVFAGFASGKNPLFPLFLYKPNIIHKPYVTPTTWALLQGTLREETEALDANFIPQVAPAPDEHRLSDAA